jgi:beta-galactosidase/beta-glucuronidase
MRNWTHHPRPEYPRPDRQRAFVEGLDWLNLNGPWEFRFDADSTGVEAGWFQPGTTGWREQILVPFCWESLAAWGEADAAGNDNYFATRVFRNPLEVTRFNYRRAPRYEIGWYRKRIAIPDNGNWQGKRAVLTIGAADFFTDCWCNGRHLGHHEGGYVPIEFDLTDALEIDESGQRFGWIVIRVEDPMENREQPVGKQWRWYSTVSGIWQTIYVEPRGAQQIDHFEITPDLHAGSARFRIFTRGGEAITAEITAPDGQKLAVHIPVADGLASSEVRLDPVILWDPNDPQLYQLTLRLRDKGAEVDVVHSYFGMRSLSTVPVEEAGAPAALSLNGQPIYLRGALYQSYHPEGIYTAGDVETLKNDILYAKRAGFDFLRVHIKIDDPLLLYYADTIGILLMTDIPNFGEGGDTPLGRRRFEAVMRAAIQRDFNHPSIISWCIFNETWGFGGQVELVKLFDPDPNSPQSDAEKQAEKLANQESYEWVQEMWRLAKSLDPTRLVEDMSVVAWEHLQYYGHGDTDINSWHFYIDDYYKRRSTSTR